MIQQLVMYEEELQQINRICEILHRDSNAKAVLVIDKNGQAIAQAGDTAQLDVTSLSSLTAGNVAATGGIAQLLAEREFAGQFHEGEKTNVHISIVGACARPRWSSTTCSTSCSRRPRRATSPRCSPRSPTTISTTCSTISADDP